MAKGSRARTSERQKVSDARFASLESDISHLTSTVQTQADNVNSLFKSVDRLKEQISTSHDALSKEIASLAEKAGRINPVVVIGLISLLLSVVIYNGKLSLEPLWKTLDSTKEWRDKELDLREKWFDAKAESLAAKIQLNEARREIMQSNIERKGE